MSDSKAKAAAKGTSTEETAKRGRGRPRKKPQVGDVIFRSLLTQAVFSVHLFIIKLYVLEDLNIHLLYFAGDPIQDPSALKKPQANQQGQPLLPKHKLMQKSQVVLPPQNVHAVALKAVQRRAGKKPQILRNLKLGKPVEETKLLRNKKRRRRMRKKRGAQQSHQKTSDLNFNVVFVPRCSFVAHVHSEKKNAFVY
ncbi:high mobility group protein HMG-I/HMG-Y isoform X1 [Aquarana catesbeiana]|uniref:high mobility group protein HMG-I/HMG-Y isoform X1 n=1 Tax=Aquarana catesbeiana TaxID=8400 RepID=UPI003CC9879B